VTLEASVSKANAFEIPRLNVTLGITVSGPLLRGGGGVPTAWCCFCVFVCVELTPFSGHHRTRNNARGETHDREEKRAPRAAQVHA
jgi:hypothetical protein